ncbi:MAG TPA: 2-isopropylmalate synthase, partial [Chroococcidiopsis sp.]
LENTIQAILAGAIGVSGTFGGIGERAGNVALEQVLNGLKLRFGWQVEGIDYEALERVTAWLEGVGARANAPYSPASQRHETGIHAHSMLRDRHSYCTFPYAEPEIWFGKYSGTSNFQYLFERKLVERKLGRSLTRDHYEQLRSAIKALSIQHNRSFSADDVIALLDQGLLRID